MLDVLYKTSVCFIDLEIQEKTNKIISYGAVDLNGNILSFENLSEYAKHITYSDFICGHNIIQHDIKYLSRFDSDFTIQTERIIDTLYWSPILFPKNPYHKLFKDDKLYEDDFNNPTNDCIKARNLFHDEISSFLHLNEKWQQILIHLLNDQMEFCGLFNYLNIKKENIHLEEFIREYFKGVICEEAILQKFIHTQPKQFAYALAFIESFKEIDVNHSFIPKWVLKNFPEVEPILFQLRNTPCESNCTYCDKELNAIKGLEKFFGYSSYRTYNGNPLQEQAVNAAIHNQSLLAVFPTGGGKSITFQVPALIAGQTLNALTVVVSPLQSLMKDQIDNLEKQNITNAVTINGLLDPIERAKSIERVENGTANLLYISPESLRSKTIEHILLNRNINRFVIDEAHCFSAWGQDFRVDYLYIADFIKKIQEKKHLTSQIPVSCFTATAKPNVIQDIVKYFKDKLGIELELFTASSSRNNLQYKVFRKENDDEKYFALRDLIEKKQCPTIVYVSRTKRATQLAERLNHDGFKAMAYHGKMDKYEKSENQNAFINGDIDIIVATSAFGMGVDKKNVQLIVHFEISDSLENYVQEAGRAGRDENLVAECFVLYNEEDLNKHFILLNQTKLSIKEVQQIWRAIKQITRFRKTVSNSALEIARAAGWDDTVIEIETRVKTAIAALEDAGYIKRKQNSNRIYANSILSKNALEAIDKISNSPAFLPHQKENAIRIIKKLFSNKSKKLTKDEDGESRIDYISDHLGIVKQEVIDIIQLLRQENILADTKDLSAYISKNETSLQNLVKNFGALEMFIVDQLPIEIQEVSLKQWNELAENAHLKQVSTKKIKTILNFWSVKNWIVQKSLYNKNHVYIHTKLEIDQLKEKLITRLKISEFIIKHLSQKNEQQSIDWNENIQFIQFSILELKNAYEESLGIFRTSVTIDDIEDALFYLSRIEALRIEGGFMVIHNRLTIERIENNTKKQYTKEDYQKLQQFYNQKVQQIHIVGEYARQMLNDYQAALQFVSDYFELNYNHFLSKYFKGNRGVEINKTLTPSKFKQLFGELSPTQLKIINDNENQNIVVAAGPGSGKTKVLVHKLASLLLMEDVKHEQLLMLTFSRAAANEFKERLHQLIGNSVHYVEIKTFHSYCFDLLGKIGNLNKTNTIVEDTVQCIVQNEVEPFRITKSVLVIDEAQDMNKNEFALVMALLEHNENMRIIAVGDDDQNIYEFRGSNSIYLQQLIKEYNAEKYELVTNYRSKNNLVQLSNTFAETLTNRIKKHAIHSYVNEEGSIYYTSYTSNTLLQAVAENISNTKLKGTTCVLTYTNDEAYQLMGLLLQKKIPTRLIQSNEGFNLLQLDEIKYFFKALDLKENTFTISEEQWTKAKRLLYSRYKHSKNFPLCVEIIKLYQNLNSKVKYISDFKNFIEESKLEDFISTDTDTVLVSTVHKAKGKEFDTIFLMLQNIDLQREDIKRTTYVALTRAKNSLHIHSNNTYLEELFSKKIEIKKNNILYPDPNCIHLHLGFRDVWLGFFNEKQFYIDQLKSGDPLYLSNDFIFTYDGVEILRFSQSFKNKLNELQHKGFKIKSICVNFIIYWYNEDLKKEYKIILPELVLKRD